MRLTWKDGFASLVVLAAAGLYVVWVTDTAYTGMSTRAVAVTVFVLGMLGCQSAGGRMASVYGAGGEQRAPLAYGVAASLIGALALISGAIAMIWASAAMLATLVVATVALWLLATARHLTPTSAPTTPAREWHPVR